MLRFRGRRQAYVWPQPVRPHSLRVLAALVLADGAVLTMADLRAVASSRMAWTSPETVHVHVNALRGAGAQIEVCQTHGYWLTRLPNDDVLMRLMPVLTALKSWWTCPAAEPICHRRRVA